MGAGIAQDSPRVSVGMPVYNAAESVASAIESILRQNLSDLELIIADNGSTDRTSEICRAYAASDSRVRLFCAHENRGAVWNYNFVLAQARAPYFKWASSSDICHPEFLARCVACLSADHRVVLAHPQTLFFHTDPAVGAPYEDDLGIDVDGPCERFVSFCERVGYNNYMNGVMRTEAIRATPQEKCYIGSDVVMMAALTLFGRFRQVPGRLFYRRMGAATIMASACSEREVREHYDPARADGMLFQVWRTRLEYLIAVGRGPISLIDKVTLWRYVARTTISMRRALLRDAAKSLRRLGARAMDWPVRWPRRSPQSPNRAPVDRNHERSERDGKQFRPYERADSGIFSRRILGGRPRGQ